MKKFTRDIFPMLLRFSKRIDEVTCLTRQNWIHVNDMDNSKIVWIFRGNHELLISHNGAVSRGHWDLLNRDSLLVDIDNTSTLYRQGFVDDNFLVLKVDGIEQYLFFASEIEVENEARTVDAIISMLHSRYFEHNRQIGRIGHIGELEYEESPPSRTFDFIFGAYDKIPLKFADGMKGEIYFGLRSGRYFFFDVVWGKKYFDDKRTCIEKYYRYRKEDQ